MCKNPSKTAYSKTIQRLKKIKRLKKNKDENVLKKNNFVPKKIWGDSKKIRKTQKK